MSGKPFLFPAAAACWFALSFLSGCSLPKIVILNDPLSVEEHNDLGRIYQAQGKLDLAEQQYREALKKDSTSAASLLLLADISYQLKKYEEAESAYRKAMRFQPGNGDIYNNLCWVYLDQNVRLEEAEALARKALDLSPGHSAYYLDTLGVILLRQRRYADSIEELEKAVSLLPSESVHLAEACLHLADAYRSAGETPNGERAGQAAARCRSRELPSLRQ